MRSTTPPGRPSSCSTSACSSTTSQPELADLLQPGHHQDPAPGATSTTTTCLRPAISTEFIESFSAGIQLPADRGLQATIKTVIEDLTGSVHSRIWIATSTSGMRAIGSDLGEWPKMEVVPDPGAYSAFYRNKTAYIIGKAINGYQEYPSRSPSATNAGMLFVDTIPSTLADIRCSAIACVFPWWIWRCPRAMCSSCAASCPNKPAASSTPCSARQAGQDWLLPRPPRPPASFQRPVHRRAGHPRIGDAGVHAAFVSLCLQRSSRTCSAHRRTWTGKQIKRKYVMVKQVDRVGRMADTLEFSHGVRCRAFTRSFAGDARTCALLPRDRW